MRRTRGSERQKARATAQQEKDRAAAANSLLNRHVDGSATAAPDGAPRHNRPVRPAKQKVVAPQNMPPAINHSVRAKVVEISGDMARLQSFSSAWSIEVPMPLVRQHSHGKLFVVDAVATCYVVPKPDGKGYLATIITYIARAYAQPRAR